MTRLKVGDRVRCNPRYYTLKWYDTKVRRVVAVNEVKSIATVEPGFAYPIENEVLMTVLEVLPDRFSKFEEFYNSENDE